MLEDNEIERIAQRIADLLRPQVVMMDSNEDEGNDDEETTTTTTETTRTVRGKGTYINWKAPDKVARLMRCYYKSGMKGVEEMARLDKQSQGAYVKKVTEELKRIEREKRIAELTGDDKPPEDKTEEEDDKAA